MPAKDGTLVVARNMGGGKPPPAVSWLPAGFAWAATVRTRILTGAQGAEMFPHLVYSHSGDRFAAVDARGAVYVFHLRANRYSLVHSAGQEVTAVAFSPRENNLVLGLADHSIRIISSDSGTVVATLKSHRQAVSSICPHPMGRYLVTCSLDACVLWDLKTNKRLQNVGSSGRIGAIQTAFLHSGNTLITLSKHEGLSLYHFPTLRLRARLTPMTNVGGGGVSATLPRKGSALQFRCFAMTPNCMYIVAATTSPRAFVWHLPSETMVEEISLPVPCATRAFGSGILQALTPYGSVESPQSSRLAYVGEDGLVRIFNVPTGEVVQQLGWASHAFAMHTDHVALSAADGSVRLVALSEAPRRRRSWVGPSKFNKSQSEEAGDSGQDGEGQDAENAPANRQANVARSARPQSCPPRDRSSGGSRGLRQSLELDTVGREKGAALDDLGVRRTDMLMRKSMNLTGQGEDARTTGVMDPATTTSSPAWEGQGPPHSSGGHGHGARQRRKAAAKGKSKVTINEGLAGKGGLGLVVVSDSKVLDQVTGETLVDLERDKQMQMAERLRAFLDVHGSFMDNHRITVYKQLLRLPNNTKAHAALVNMGTHPLATSQLQRYTVSDSRLRNRLARVVHALSQWCEILASCDFLPAFVYPWLDLFERDECLCVEMSVMFLLNWAAPWFKFWPSPPLHLMGAVDRLLFALDPYLSRHLANIEATAKDFAWPLLRTCFSQVCDRSAWLYLMDHVLTQPPDHLVYILVAFLHHCRRALLSLETSSQIPVFTRKAHPVDPKTIVRIARDLGCDPRAHKIAEEMGVTGVVDEALQLTFLGASADTLAYPLLVSFPTEEVTSHMAQIQQIREDEERYLQQKRLAAEMEAHAERLAKSQAASQMGDELVEAARAEQREQLKLLAKQRRDRARLIEERARMTRLDQIKWMTEQEEESRSLAAQKQQRALLDFDMQLADQAEEDEEWLKQRLEAERLEQLEFAMTLQLQQSKNQRAEYHQRTAMEAELGARRQVIELQKRSAEQRWAIEDSQQRAQRTLAAAEAAQEEEQRQAAQDRLTAEVMIKTEQERMKQELLVVDAHRKARSLAEEQRWRAHQRLSEQARVEEVMAGEELRHLDAAAMREEQAMMRRMRAAEAIISNERAELAAMKEKRSNKLRALQAQQRIEGFGKAVQEQKGHFVRAAHEHDRQVHGVLLDIEEERRGLMAMDEQVRWQSELAH